MKDELGQMERCSEFHDVPTPRGIPVFAGDRTTRVIQWNFPGFSLLRLPYVGAQKEHHGQESVLSSSRIYVDNLHDPC